MGPALDVHAVSAGAVHSVFARAVNLEIRGDLWTLTGADQGELAFGIRVGARTFDAFGLCRGERVDVRSGFVGIGPGSRRLVVDCRAAPRWMPAVPAKPVPGLSQRLAVVAGAVRHRCWSGSPRLAGDVTSALRDPRCPRHCPARRGRPRTGIHTRRRRRADRDTRSSQVRALGSGGGRRGRLAAARAAPAAAWNHGHQRASAAAGGWPDDSAGPCTSSWRR